MNIVESMMGSIYFVVAFSLAVSLLVRFVSCSLSFGWFSRGFAGDSSVHLQIIKQIKRGWGARAVENYVIPNKMSYPVLFHRLCAFFPIQFLKSYSYLPNLLVYAVSFATFVFFSFYCQEEFFPATDSVLLSGCLLAHLFCVQNLVTAGPAIAYLKLSSRFLAKIACSFFVLFLFIHLEFHLEAGLYLASFFAAIGILSGTFAAQLLLFFALFFFLITGCSEVISSLALGVLLSVVFSKGYSLRSLLGMVRYWRIYFLRVRKSRYTAPVLSSLVSLPDLFRNLLSGRFQIFAKQLYKREPTRAILHYPEILLALYFLFFTDHEFVFLSEVYLAVLLAYLLTSTKVFNFLGESYRYLEYGLFFLNPLALAFLIGSHYGTKTGLFIMGGCAAYGICSSLLINRLCGHSHVSGRDNLSDFLCRLKITPSDVVFPVSMRLGADIVARVGCRSFWWQPGGITELSMYDDYLHEYPYLSLDWKKLCDRHQVDYVIVDKTALAKFLDVYNFKSLSLELEDENYLAYRYPVNSSALI